MIRFEYWSKHVCVYKILKSRIDTYLALLVSMFPLWIPFENNFSSIVTILPIHYHRASSFEPSHLHENMSIGYQMGMLTLVMGFLNYLSLFVSADSPLLDLSCYETFQSHCPKILVLACALWRRVILLKMESNLQQEILLTMAIFLSSFSMLLVKSQHSHSHRKDLE